MHQFKWFDWTWLVTVGIATSCACVVAARDVGVTFDEPIYLEHGLNFWHTGSHRPLMKLGTMPLPVDVQTFPIAAAEWVRGHRFESSQDFSRLIVWMRHGNLVFWWMLLYFGMRLAFDLGGRWAGRIAITALSCEPNLLAHAALATTDIAITATLLGFACAYRRGRGRHWKCRVAWPGLWCGLALLSKASALVFCPILMLAIEIARRFENSSDASFRQFMGAFLRDGFGIGVIGFAIAFLGCGCDFRSNDWFVYWANEMPQGTLRSFTVWFAEHLRVFSNAGEALANQVHHNLRGHGQFLMGESSERPFWYYFPVLMFVKLTLPVVAGLIWILIYRRVEARRNVGLIAFALLMLFSVNCRVQLGIRMQFPAVAMLIVGLSVSVIRAWPCLLPQRMIASSVLAAGLFGMAAISAMSFPNGLRYANALWGEPHRIHWLVGDSNYDWGQGLRELDQWHSCHGRPGLDVWYFGQDPSLKTMPVRDLPLHCLPLSGPEDFPQYLWGRKLAVSTSLIHGSVLTSAHHVALQFLGRRQPIDRTATFVIYDFSDLKPPRAAVSAELAE